MPIFLIGEWAIENRVSRIDVWLPGNGNSGYMYGDFNLYGGTDVTDRIDYRLPNNGIGTQVP